MTNLVGSTFMASLFLLSACGNSDATPTTDAGAGAIDSGVPELPATSAAALTTAGFALGVASALTGPLAPQAASLRDGGGRLDGAAREMRTRTDVEAGVSGMSVVTPATCASYAWSGLSVTVTFAGCTLEATGESLDGSIGVAVTFFPTTFTLTFTSLTVGTTQVDGMLVLNVGGACGGGDLGCTPCMDTDTMCAAMRATQTTVTGNLTVRSAGTTVVAITGLTLSVDATGIAATGDFAIGGTAATATAVHWNSGECLPSSGTVSLPATTTTITFLSTTPTDGVVDVRIASFPSFPQMLFMPCTP